jgi:galactokinase
MPAPESFEACFALAPTVAAEAPGRVNLIGEHTDYNGGCVLPVAIEPVLRLWLRYREDRRVRGHSREQGPAEATLDSPKDGSWLDYPRGIALQLIAAGRIPERGFDLFVASELPAGAGLSSSAALEVACGAGLAAAAGGPLRDSELPELAQLCRLAEREFVGVPCGIMDPYVIACAQPGRATLLDCDSMRAKQLELPAGLEVCIIDTGERRGLRDGDYRARQEECEAARCAAAEFLGRPLERLCAVLPRELGACEAALEPGLYRRLRHVVRENARVAEFATASAAGDLPALAALMYASHASLRDDYQVSWSRADFVVERARDVPGVFGARMTGAGFGGCVVALVRGADLEPLASAFEAKFKAPLLRWNSRPVAGARVLSLRSVA